MNETAGSPAGKTRQLSWGTTTCSAGTTAGRCARPAARQTGHRADLATPSTKSSQTACQQPSRRPVPPHQLPQSFWCPNTTTMASGSAPLSITADTQPTATLQHPMSNKNRDMEKKHTSHINNSPVMRVLRRDFVTHFKPVLPPSSCMTFAKPLLSGSQRWQRLATDTDAT